jgi:PPM family protein phosphatase
MTEQKTVGALKLRAFGATDIGRRRTCNEDRVLVLEERGLYLVADGAGGHDAGDLAAEGALRAIAEHVSSLDPQELDSPSADSFGMPRAARRLAAAVQHGNRDVRQLARHRQTERGVGTTVVAALFSPRAALLHVAHVGDSRCYRFRGGHLELLTQDHSLITDVLEERPDISDDVLAKLPKHVVTRALGMDDKVRVAVRSHAIVAGDRYLLCTDGLSGPLPSSRIGRTLAEHADPREAVGALIGLANDAGGPDNVTALVLAFDGPMKSMPYDSVRDSELDYYDPSQASDPELLILGIEEIDLGRSRDTASDDLLNALGALMDRRIK